MQPRYERHLAAILAADVVGYSRLMGMDEEGTLAQLNFHKRALIDPKIAEHRGRIVKTTGDGVLVEFASVVDAVRCAIDVQRGMAERNLDVPKNKRVEFRIGINVGDVIVDGDDIFGDGVNVAARLEGISEPGGVCLSEDAYRHVSGKIQIPARDLGPQSLKNIAHPIRVYSLGSDAIAAPPPVALALPASVRSRSKILRRLVVGLLIIMGIGLGGLVFHFRTIVTARVPWLVTGQSQPASERLSLVILPFINLGGDPTQDYLANAITEELTTGLSRISGSFVIARTTAFTYKGKPIDARQIGRDLGVHYILEGSTQPSGSRVRTNAQLISAETGAHLWADRFDADRADLLQMQDEIVTHLARILEIQLWKVDAARVTRAHSANQTAEDLAWQCVSEVYTKMFQRDYSLCERAFLLDPRNALALAILAFKFVEPVLQGESTDIEGDIRRADELVSQALVVDPNLYLAHHIKAWILLSQKRFEETLIETDRSLSLNPSFVDSYIIRCLAHDSLGRPGLALEYADKAIRLSPRDPYLPNFYWQKGLAYLLMREDAQAIDWMRRTLAAWPEWPLGNVIFAGVLASEGKDVEARDTLQRYLSLNGAKRTVSGVQFSSFADTPFWSDATKRVREGLRRAGMPEG
jgi:class 3 adenylate cyclase/TolB-like protein